MYYIKYYAAIYASWEKSAFCMILRFTHMYIKCYRPCHAVTSQRLHSSKCLNVKHSYM